MVLLYHSLVLNIFDQCFLHMVSLAIVNSVGQSKVISLVEPTQFSYKDIAPGLLSSSSHVVSNELAKFDAAVFSPFVSTNNTAS